MGELFFLFLCFFSSLVLKLQIIKILSFVVMDSNKEHLEKKPPRVKQRRKPKNQPPKTQQPKDQSQGKKPVNFDNSKPTINSKTKNPKSKAQPKENDYQDMDSPKPQNLVGFGNIRSFNPRLPEQIVQKPEKKPMVNKKALIQEHSVGHGEFSSQIIADLVNNKYECSICMVLIKKNTAVWSCDRCFGIWHIFCTKQWSKVGKEENSAKKSWGCPKCRAEYTAPPQSWCFCRKQKQPPNDLMRIPHSCGELCLKFREGTSCPHPCTLLCHPGPCPPCGAMGKMAHCYCGKSNYMLLCGVEDKGRSCNSMCGKTLNCGKHKCNEICHSGECQDCTHLESQKCYCGKEEENRLCGSGVEDITVYGKSDPRYFSCKEVCQRLLQCGNHKCEKVCHAGECAPCMLSPSILSTCGCGRTPAKHRTSCLDPIPTCNNVCGKIMKCGHTCVKDCHIGECSDCLQEVSLKCRCGLSSKTAICKDTGTSEVFLCSRVCTKKKSCGKHICATKCCPTVSDPTDKDGVHVCVSLCNKRLKCGTHNCKNICHKGHCPPCLEADYSDKVCACGKTIQHAPIRCGTPPLECTQECKLPRACGHPQTYHTCHFGECPPCVYLTTKQCACGKTMVENVKCFSSIVLCGKKCQREMSCGLHVCKRECHLGACEKSISEGSKSCGFPCDRSLSTCHHTCQIPCHPDIAECPKVPCTMTSTVYCECKRIKKEVPCIGLEERTLECDEACQKEFRMKKLEEAFGIHGSGNFVPRYSSFLINYAQSTPNFAFDTENLLELFLKTKETKYTLPPYEKLQRQFIHELCKYYGLSTESFVINGSTKKDLVITKKSDSKVPNVLLSDIAGINKSSKGLSTTLLVYGLNKNVRTSDLYMLFQASKGDFKVQWLDEESCLLVFKLHYKMMKALNSFERQGQFRVRIHNDQSGPIMDGHPDYIRKDDASSWGSDEQLGEDTVSEKVDALSDEINIQDIEVPDDWGTTS